MDKGLITKRKAMLLMRRTVRNVIRNYRETTFDKNEEGQGGVKRGEVGEGWCVLFDGCGARVTTLRCDDEPLEEVDFHVVPLLRRADVQR